MVCLLCASSTQRLPPSTNEATVNQMAPVENVAIAAEVLINEIDTMDNASAAVIA